jgi:hypothetical protein
MTHDEVRAVDARCRERGIELVANQQSLGHMHRWLRHDRYRPLAEVPEGVVHAFGLEKEPFSLCPTDPASLAFLAGLYDELLPCFSSGELNVGDTEWVVSGGDGQWAWTPPPIWNPTGPWTKPGGINHVNGFSDPDVSNVGWVFPQQLSNDPKSIAEVVCHEAGHSFAAPAALLGEHGRDFYVCPGTSGWQSIAGRTENAVRNLTTAAGGARIRRCGYLVTDWGDRGHLSRRSRACPDSFSERASPGTRRAAATGAARSSRARVQSSGNRLRAQRRRSRQRLPRPGSPATNRSALFLARIRERTSARADAGLSSRDSGAREKIVGVRGSRRQPGRPTFSRGVRSRDRAALHAAGIGDRRSPELRSELAARFASLAGLHRERWLETSRPGGLAESAAWIERVVALLA